MAKLPGLADLGASPRADPARPVGTYDVSSFARGGAALAEGGRALGQGVAKAGEGASDLALDEGRWDYARAHANQLSQKIDAYNELQNDNDYATMPDRYGKKIKAINDESAALIQAGPMRERFLMDTRSDVAQFNSNVDAHARKLEGVANNAYRYEARDKFIDYGVTHPDESTRADVIDKYNLMVDGAVAKRYIDPLQAAHDKKDFAHRYANASALALIDRDPGEAVRALENPEPKSIFSVIPAEQRLSLLAHARSANLGEQHAVKDLINDDVTSVLNTGQGVPGITPERVKSAFGPKGERAVAEWQTAGEDAKKIWDVAHDFPVLNDTEMFDRVEEMRPKPGAPGYARQQVLYEALVKRADDTYKLRQSDPARAVSDDAAVKQAQAGFSKADPSSFQPLAKARMLAQTKLGIPEDSQSPITKEEALRLTVPLRSMLPGQERSVLTKLAQDFQQMFGENAGVAFEYALRAHKVDNATASAAAGVMRKLGLGKVPDREDAGGADQTSEVGAADQAIGAQQAQDAREAAASRTAASMRRKPGSQSVPMVQEGPVEPAPGVSIPRRAIQYLRSNPASAVKFDVEFGKGAAKKILDQYPAGVNNGG